MRTLRFIGMAIVAVIMSVNFAACSDDDEQAETNTNKLIKKLVTDYGDGDIETETFKYDNSGKVIEYLYSFPSEGEELHIYTYKDNEIVDRVTWNDELSPSNSEEYTVRYSLINGRIISKERTQPYSYKWTYIYNQDNQLQSVTEGLTQENYIWKDGNMIQGEYSYIYSSHKNGTNLDINGIINDEGLAAFFGATPVNLVDKKYYDGELMLSYQYEFDSKDNLIKIIVTEDDGGKYTIAIEY